MPAGEMLEGVFLLLGGGLLLLPGFFTDAVGFLCLIPYSRQFFSKWLLRNSSIKMNATTGFGANATGGSIIDGEFVRRSDDRLDH